MTINLKIITSYDERFKDVGDLCAASIKHYSRYHGFNYEIKDNLRVDRHPSWAKIFHLINELSTEKYDYILWIDADACFVDFEANILDETVRKNLNTDFWIANHLCTLKSFKSWKKPRGIFRFGTFGQLIGSIFLTQQSGVYIQIERPNGGVLLFKNTDWSRNFLNKIWNSVYFLEHAFLEQAAIQNLMGYYLEPSNGFRKNMINHSVLEHIQWLPDRWNCVPTEMNISIGKKPITQQAINPAIVHFANFQNSKRVIEMKKLLSKIL